MNLRDALIQQSPSLELQRAAQAEIARLDHQLSETRKLVQDIAQMDVKGHTLADRLQFSTPGRGLLARILQNLPQA